MWLLDISVGLPEESTGSSVSFTVWVFSLLALAEPSSVRIDHRPPDALSSASFEISMLSSTSTDFGTKRIAAFAPWTAAFCSWVRKSLIASSSEIGH